MTRLFRSLSVKIPLLGVALLLSCAISVAYPIYVRARGELESTMSRELLGIARSCAALIDAEAHEDIFALSESEFEGRESFGAIREILRDVHAANLLEKPIYTLRPTLDYEKTRELEFVVMTDLRANAPYVGNRIAASRYAREVLTSGVAICTPLYEDSEGSWLSAIAPIFYEDEVVALVFVDYPGTEFAAALESMRTSFVLVAAIATVFCGICLVLFVRPLVRRIRRLTEGTLRVAAGDLESPIGVQGDDEIGRLATSFDAMVENIRSARGAAADAIQLAEHAARAKASFLANMSHELRTPMTAILGFADLIAERDTLTDGQFREYVTTIQKNGQHLLVVINDILDFSKIEAGKLALDLCPVSLSRALGDAIDLMQLRAAEKGLALEIEYRSEVPELVLTDEIRLRQILVNLIGNAIKFTDEGNVTIRAHATPRGERSTLTLEISDTGVGISEEHLERLFGEFEQADNSITRKFGGTGLGLAISKRLAKMLGGDLTVESSVGHGSTFFLTLPIRRDRDTRWISSPRQATPVHALTKQKSKIELTARVLLVEDGAATRRLVSHVLTKAGASVVEAENGRLGVDAALAAVEEGRPFDAILMDMQMPVLDGYGATRELRKKGYRRPIIALTANAFTDDRDKCLEAGCDDFQPKPIDRDALLQTIADHAHGSTELEPS